MNGQIREIVVANEDANIFSDDSVKYIIPLYQRAFAWEDTEITQLIEDIRDFKEGNYHIGSLIVAKNDNAYEVIDGQQRLTALFLLLNSLGFEVKNILTFACREKSNYTLQNINNLLLDKNIEQSLQKGKQIIDATIKGRDFDAKNFKTQLSKVKLYRIEVPENTDLNRYFEIMNTRGEQLEQHDILKASLMGALEKNKKELFAKIWDACSDMTGYAQMHFTVDLRKRLFGDEWNSTPNVNFTDVAIAEESAEKTIREIIKPSFKVDDGDGIADKNERVRFESIITFPYFLLHCLKVFVADKSIAHEITGQTLVYELLDDKKLTDAFDRVITCGVISGQKVANGREWFSEEFIKCLLKCRFLFDKYIIKREFVNENSDGEWSLKELKVSGQASNKKAYYTDTYFGKKSEWESTWSPRAKINLMLESCLRVSYTSPKIMHWITALLKWVNVDTNLWKLNEFENLIEDTAKTATREDFLIQVPSGGSYNLGVNTPHIVFNYLDYLLWKENKVEYGNFVFEFRNSVEHWYPQHPSEGTFEPWSPDGEVDNFGNLCIVQRNINSKFSNMSPAAKKTTFPEMIAKGSLKLRIMADATGGDVTASKNWRESGYIEHEKQMIEKLKSACNG